MDDNSGIEKKPKMTTEEIADMFGAFPNFEIPVDSSPEDHED